MLHGEASRLRLLSQQAKSHEKILTWSACVLFGKLFGGPSRWLDRQDWAGDCVGLWARWRDKCLERERVRQ